MGIGVATLALSRPFEGMVLTLLTGLAVAIALFRQGSASALPAMGKIAAGFVPVMIALFAFLGIYNKAITGNPLIMPYVVYEKGYGGAPVFLWQTPGPMPETRHRIFQQLAQQERNIFVAQQTASGFIHATLVEKVGPVLREFTWMGLLLVPLVFLFRVRENATAVKTGAAILAGLLVANTTVICMFPHYTAPAFGLFLALVVAGMREMRRSLGERGICFSRLLVMLLLTVSVLFYSVRMQKRRKIDRWDLDRQELSDRLEKLPEKSLVLVTTKPLHNCNQSWVQNGADIDSAKVVWAHSMADNSRLLDYYKDRKTWLLTVENDRFWLNPPLPKASPADAH